eukprot:2960248-Prymnesium_polylepis.2
MVDVRQIKREEHYALLKREERNAGAARGVDDVSLGPDLGPILRPIWVILCLGLIQESGRQRGRDTPTPPACSQRLSLR